MTDFVLGMFTPCVIIFIGYMAHYSAGYRTLQINVNWKPEHIRHHIMDTLEDILNAAEYSQGNIHDITGN